VKIQNYSLGIFKIFKIIRWEYSKYSKLFAGNDKNPRLVHEPSYRTEKCEVVAKIREKEPKKGLDSSSKPLGWV